MLIFYVDECGDSSIQLQPDIDPPTLKRGTSDYFVLSAVGIRDTSRKPLAEALHDIKNRHFGVQAAQRPWGDTEIKGRYLFRAARSAANGRTLQSPVGYSTLTTSEEVDALITDLAGVLTRFRPLIFSAIVDKRAILKRTDRNPIGIAYAYLHQRVALTMEQIYPGEGAILIADQQTQHESYFRSGDMNALRDQLTQNLKLKPDFRLVLDKPLWVDTDLSSWDREIIQLADIVAYSSAECMRRGAAPTERCYLWPEIRACLAVNWSSTTLQTGGFSIHPKPRRYPAI